MRSLVFVVSLRCVPAVSVRGFVGSGSWVSSVGRPLRAVRLACFAAPPRINSKSERLKLYSIYVGGTLSLVL